MGELDERTIRNTRPMQALIISFKVQGFGHTAALQAGAQNAGTAVHLNAFTHSRRKPPISLTSGLSIKRRLAHYREHWR